jgi:hypothetical protein
VEVVLKEKFWADIPWTAVPRLVERDFPDRIPPTERNSRPTKRCVGCYKKRETVFWYPDCEAGLYVEGCFKTHTQSSTIKIKSI